MKRKIHNAWLWIQVTKHALPFLPMNSFLRLLQTQMRLRLAVVLLIVSAAKITFLFLGLKSCAAVTLLVTLSQAGLKR